MFPIPAPGGTATIIGMVPFGMKSNYMATIFCASGRSRVPRWAATGSARHAETVECLEKGDLKLDHLISSHIKLDDINEGYANLKGGQVLRQLIDFGVAK